MPRLVTAVLHLDKPHLESLWERADGSLRLVDIGWKEREFHPVPPENWPKMAEEEMAFQDAEKLARDQGRSVDPPPGVK